MRIQIANSDQPTKRLWLELPIANDPTMSKTIGKMASLIEPGQTQVTVIVTDIEAPVPNLGKYILTDDFNTGIEQMNRLAQKISVMDGITLSKFSGALDIEPVNSMGDIQRIADSLDDYELLPGVTTDYDYGYHVLYETDLEERDIEPLEELKDFIDFEAYGKYRMEEDGVRETDLGMMRRISEPFNPERNMEMGGLSQ